MITSNQVMVGCAVRMVLNERAESGRRKSCKRLRVLKPSLKKKSQKKALTVNMFTMWMSQAFTGSRCSEKHLF